MPGIHRRLVVSASLVAGLVATAAAVGGLSGQALADPAGASNWHVGVYAPSGRALALGDAGNAGGALATFQFTSAPNTALLLNTQGSQKGTLLGDIAGKTVSATFTISGGNEPFTYYGEPDTCGTPASVRLFFETTNAGGFDPTHYWWSNGVGSASLADGTFTLTAQVSPSLWSDYYGQFGSSVGAGFDAAVSDVTGIGLSFGGGCGFENGVGAPDATLVLSSFTVS